MTVAARLPASSLPAKSHALRLCEAPHNRNMTYQIVYSSEAAAPMQTGDLEKLLDHARRSNAANGITGALVYAEGSFLQILEGDTARVQELMAKIQRDVRHEAVLILREGEVPEAIFGSWKMAFVSAT